MEAEFEKHLKICERGGYHSDRIGRGEREPPNSCRRERCACNNFFQERKSVGQRNPATGVEDFLDFLVFLALLSEFEGAKCVGEISGNFFVILQV